MEERTSGLSKVRHTAIPVKNARKTDKTLQETSELSVRYHVSNTFLRFKKIFCKRCQSYTIDGHIAVTVSWGVFGY